MKILIADDDPLSVLYLQDMLHEWGMEVSVAADSDAVLAELQRSDGPLLAILDSVIAGVDAIDVCRQIREDVTERYVYVILLGAQADPDFASRAADAGADEYIAKPFTPAQVRVRVRAGWRIAELEALLRYRESRDVLTGLYNRGHILDLLQRELARQARTHHGVSVIFCDLDNFKEINSAHGHRAGDEVLCEVTRRMALTLRPYDSFGRYASEELLAVLPDCPLPGALEVAERMRAEVAELPVATTAGPIGATVSIGVATVAPDQVSKLRELMQRVDEALHRAKQNGRNCITLAGEEYDAAKP